MSSWQLYSVAQRSDNCYYGAASLIPFETLTICIFFLPQLEGVKLVKVVDKLLYNDRVETRVGEEKPLEDVNARLQQCLHLPIKFRFKLGFVEKEIITEKGMPEWCVNIQRAIVNHMYLPIQDNNEKYQTRENEVWKTDVN